MKNITYQRLDVPHLTFYKVLGVVLSVLTLGLLSAWYMEHNGHWVTGMNNQIVWGLPHVFAVFLIVTASGALNIASIGAVFNRGAYKPLNRLSGLLAVSFLIGGLAVLVLDLGRPDRLIVAMTRYNFSSIFAWNIYLYSGFIAVVGFYIWTMMDRSMTRFYKLASIIAFVWRLALTTGTGVIFGFLVAREAYDAAIMAPMFIAMSFAFGLAAFILVLAIIYNNAERPFGGYLLRRMGRLLGIFIIAVQYFVLTQHLTNLYAAEHSGYEQFILLDGGIITTLFWLGQVLIGAVIPAVILLGRKDWLTARAVYFAAGLVILGGLTQVYVIIIGGQAFPMTLFPGMEVSSTMFDGVVHTYTPTIAEIGLGISGLAIAATIAIIAMRILAFLPADLSDKAVNPHHSV
jgi:molybdopterin-containing oxidoreductase family membrane subunit